VAIAASSRHGFVHRATVIRSLEMELEFLTEVLRLGAADRRA
jgi:hypothetical protein